MASFPRIQAKTAAVNGPKEPHMDARTDAPGLFAAASRNEKARTEAEAGRALTEWIDEAHRVGEVIETGPDEFKVLVHDKLRGQVGGIPLRCFLLATRLTPESSPAPFGQDTRLVLLRVMGSTPAASKDVEMIKMSAARRSADETTTWDDKAHMDKFSLNELRYDIVTCRVVGSFEMRQAERGYKINFAYDIRDTFRGMGFKVYKPIGAFLQKIVNYSKPPQDDDHPLKKNGVALDLGHLRYTSAGYDERALTEENILVRVDPTDLTARKTTLLGMSRTGKSNTTKVIIQSVFELREVDPKIGRIGMVIFDPNGEYANLTLQDDGINATAIRDVWKNIPSGKEEDVLVYGWTRPTNDPKRRVIKVNFFGRDPADWKDEKSVQAALEPLLIGKEIVDGVLEDESSKYIKAFRDTQIQVEPVYTGAGELTRIKRVLLAYRTILAAAGYLEPKGMSHPSVDGLFGADLRNAMAASYPNGAELLGKGSLSWNQAHSALRDLAYFMRENDGFKKFNDEYVKKNSHDWADPVFAGIIGLLSYPSGIKTIKRPIAQHEPEADKDFAAEISLQARQGKMIIIDQSTGDPDLVAKAAERIGWALFNAQKEEFKDPKLDDKGKPMRPPDVLIFIEEAHNLLPTNSESVIANVWSRIAKEASKFRIGMLLATQEPSLIQRYILSNCDNWFIGYMFSGKEIAVLSEYGDFKDFASHIGRNADPGLLIVRTLSNPYSVPVQIRRFLLPGKK